MSKKNNARNNPVVKQKLEQLNEQWQPLSDVERWEKIKELRELDCPWADIGTKVGLTESGVRAYKRFDVVPAQVEEPNSDSDPVLQLLRDASKDRPRTATATQLTVTKPPEPALDCKEKVKAAVNKLLDRSEARQYQIQTLDLLDTRCRHWEYGGGVPQPLSPDVDPDSLIASFDRESQRLNPGALIEHLAVSLFKLVPTASERDQIIRELRAERVPVRSRF